MQNSTNPLASHFRQPAIYLKLPSGGKFWAPGSLNLPANGEIGIMPTTTKDEILLRTPDALMNGDGVVKVIQSCCPNITDAWQTPAADLDAILIAIRIASYGPNLTFTVNCPECNTVNQYVQDLNYILNSIKLPDYNLPIETQNLKIFIKPQNYKHLNKEIGRAHV